MSVTFVTSLDAPNPIYYLTYKSTLEMKNSDREKNMVCSRYVLNNL